MNECNKCGYLDCNWQCDYEAVSAENSRLRAALESISKNSCCDACQQAKLVAIAALEGRGIPETLSLNPATPPKAEDSHE